MSSPDESEVLTPEEARARVAEIRHRLRPRQLEELRRLYHQSRDDVESRALILAEEIRLQKLDGYLTSLIPKMRGEGEALGWDDFRPPLRALHRPGPGRIEAEVEMAHSPESHECVHGPATLVPVAKLARKLLADGERIGAIERVTWAQPIRHAVRLSVWDAAAAEGARPEGAAFFGRLRTSESRALEFAAMPLTDRLLVGQRDYNALSRLLVKAQKLVPTEDGEGVTLELTAEGLAACRRRLGRNAALRAALLLDLVGIAILSWRRGRPMVDCGFQDVPLPKTAAETFAAGTRLEVRYRTDLSHHSTNSDLTIGHYDFRYFPRQSEWSTTIMAEADAMETILRKLHS